MGELNARIARLEGGKTTGRTYVWPLLGKPDYSIVMRPGLDSLELPDEEVARRFPEAVPISFRIGEIDPLAGPDLDDEAADTEEPEHPPMLPAPRSQARQSPAEASEPSPPQSAPSESPCSASQRRQAARLESTFRELG